MIHKEVGIYRPSGFINSKLMLIFKINRGVVDLEYPIGHVF